MTGKVYRGAGRLRDLRLLFDLGACSALAAVILSTLPAAAQSPPYFNNGLRWIGTTVTGQSCSAPTTWRAERLFSAAPNLPLPPGLGDYCRFTWTGPIGGPTPSDVSTLFTVSAAQNMTEDVPVLAPSGYPAFPSDEETAFLTGLHDALLAQVGDVSLLPDIPPTPAVRVVVIDSAPDAIAGQIRPGASRHGDTLAHLIEDIVCTPGPGRRCAAEVTTMLALPWTQRNVGELGGGQVGTLIDLAQAIERAVLTWQDDLKQSPWSTPSRLVLNLSLGWENTPQIADCSAAIEPEKFPAGAVQGALQHAASLGALIIAAAGNDSGGPTPRRGLVCPGLYQAVPRDNHPTQSLVVAVSGVDYQDHPLETTRPDGTTGIVGLGLGGVAWDPNDPVPPALTGSSISTAVVSAVSAVVWAARPDWTPGQVTMAVYAGGTPLGPADACPRQLAATCPSHRVSVCGALQAAGTSPSCSPPPPKAGSGPDLSREARLLDATYAGVTRTYPAAPPPAVLPRYLFPTVQVDPYVFPAPISTTCRTCVVAENTLFVPQWDPQSPDQVLESPVLVMQTTGSPKLVIVPLGPSITSSNGPYVFPLGDHGSIQSAYLTGFDASTNHSVTEQIFVQPSTSL